MSPQLIKTGVRPIASLAWAVLVVAALVAGICQSAFAWTPGTANPTAAQGFVVDPTDRTDVLAFYNTIYPASEGYDENISWTGNLATGVAGTTSAPFKEDVRRRINFYRALVGLPADIVFDDTKSAKCQAAALMFSANDAISHYPPTSWTYYTANGAEAAGSSNIALGSYGAGAVDAYIVDTGSNNYRVGHRRWLLYSLANEMATGDVPPNGDSSAGNAIWVIGNFKSSGPEGFVTWPNRGYTPQNLVPARWSISYPEADFSSATITMTQEGASIPVTVISQSDDGYGDNTLVWEPVGLQSFGSADVHYTITISGIGGTGVPSSYSYAVTAFNPGILGQSVTISGTSTPPVSGQEYTFNAIAQADQYQLRVSTGSAAAWTEGAEDLSAILDLTASGYALAQSTVKRSGSQAFHLTFPSFADGDQSFEVNRDIVPSSSSQLQFYDLFRFVTTASRLSAEISEDSGSTWTEIWARNGNGSSSSSGWDSAFNARAVSLADYAGKPVRIRFIFRDNNSAYLGTGTDTGVFLDDLSISAATELMATTTTTLAGSATAFTLNASTAGSALAAGITYYLRIRPNVGTRWFGAGPLKTVIPTSSPGTLMVTFDAQGGAAPSPASKSVTYGAAYGTLATTTRAGYTFAGWWAGVGGTGTQVTAATVLATAANHTLYAKWTAVPSYTVTFDAQGGAAPSPASKSVTYGTAYGTLATTTRAGYTFAGWWTGAGGTGTQRTAATIVATAANHTLYAKYTVSGGVVPPTVTTAAAAVIGSTTATGGGTVTNAGGAVVTARGVCWSSAVNPTVANAKTINGTGTGAFNSTLTKLSPNTKYYVRAYATNSAGTGYGAPQSVTTPVAAGADFVITSIVLTPALPAVGGKVTAVVTVLNQGIVGGKAGTLHVWVNKSAPAAVGEKGDKSASISTLKPGVSKVVKLSLTAPKTWGTFTLRAFIDAKNGVKEDDEYNNQELYVYDTGLPDFEIQDVSISPATPVAGQTFTAYVTVTNSGEVAGDAGYLDLWADSSGLTPAPVPGAKTKGNKYKTVGTLQPGQEKTVTVTGLKAPAGTAWTLGLLIDSRAKTLELNETSNWLEFDY